MKKSIHHPVFLKETLEALNVKINGKYIDATYGMGGHSEEISQKGGMVLGIDYEQSSINNAKVNQNTKIKLVKGNFKDICAIAKKNNYEKVDGIIFDLGLSWYELANLPLGLSYKNTNQKLDMRLSDEFYLSASDIIKSTTTKNLANYLFLISQETNSDLIAREIKKLSSNKYDLTVGMLVSAIAKVVPSSVLESTLKRVFQTLRILVNHEFENLTQALNDCPKILEKNAVVVVITFHQSEDRLVKDLLNKPYFVNHYKKPLSSKSTKRYEASARLRAVRYIS